MVIEVRGIPVHYEEYGSGAETALILQGWGTKAALYPGQVEKAEKAQRAHRAQEIADEMQKAYLAACVGQTLPVLFEAECDGICTGHADNYTEVSVPGTMLRGLVRNVKITGVEDERLVGDLL